MQLSRLRDQADEYGQRQEAAKAVLNAARMAKREGRTLSDTEISSIEAPIFEKAAQTVEKPREKVSFILAFQFIK